MPGTVFLTNRQTGQDEPVAAEQVEAALASGRYLDPGAVAVHRFGADTYATPDIAAREAPYTPTIDPAIAAEAAGHQIRERENSTIGAGVRAALGGAASGLTFGLVDPFQDEQEFNRGLSIGGQVAGAFAPALIGDEAGLLGLGRLGGQTSEGARAAEAVGTAAAAESAQAIGHGAAGVADDALTAERATSALSSRALLTGERAADASELEHGLLRANGAIDEAHEAAAVAPDLAGLDAKGLRAAHDAELQAIEASRVPLRAQIADDLAAFRDQAKADKLWLSTKGGAAAAEPAEAAAPGAAAGIPPSGASKAPSFDLEAAQEAADALPAEPSGRVRLYRASDRDGIVAGAHFTPELESAVAYMDNPGFGGGSLKAYDVPRDYVLDIYKYEKRHGVGSQASLEEFAKELELPDPELQAERWRDAGYRNVFQVLENDRRNLDAVAGKMYDWVTFTDDFPQGAQTWKYVGEKPLDVEGKLLGTRTPASQRAASALADKGAIESAAETRPPPRVKLTAEETRAVKEAGKISLDADKQLDRVLRNPKALAENPRRALGALQQQEHALERIVAQDAKLRTVFAGDTSGERIAALDKIPATIERNRALQRRIAELEAKPASERLAAISHAQEQLPIAQQAAREAAAAARQAEREAAAEARATARQAKIDAKLADIKPEASMAEQALSGTAFGAITGAAHALPIIGQIPGAAHIIGAKGAKFVTDLVFRRLGKTAAGLEARAGAAADRFLDTAGRAATPQAAALAVRGIARATAVGARPPSASSTLVRVSFAAGKPAPKQGPGAAVAKDVVAHYQARSAEIRSQTMYDAAGNAVLRPEVRQAIGDRLAAIRAVKPLLADRMETVAARRIEYLSSILPRKPDMGGVQIGPDRWMPSDLEIRSWARSVAAVEDPHAVLERAAHGHVVIEEARAMQAVYPEVVRDYVQRLTAHLADLPKALPYRRRLALSILSGVPVDPAMQPAVLRELQAMYVREPGTEGGTQAPRPEPQFGSVRRGDPGTPSQRRQGLAT